MNQVGQELLAKIQAEKDWHRVIVFTEQEKVICEKQCTLLPDELKFYVNAFEKRDTTVGEGFFINNEHFDVHRFHPPLIYGRRGGPEDGEGIGLVRFKPRSPTGDGETYQYLLATYLLPILSAKALPQMVKFCETHTGNPE